MKFSLYSIRSFIKRLFSPCSWLGLLNASESHKPDNTGLGWRRNTLDHLTFLLWRTGGTAIDLNSHRKPSFFFFEFPAVYVRARVCEKQIQSKKIATPIWVFYRSMADACPGCPSEMRPTSEIPSSSGAIVNFNSCLQSQLGQAFVQIHAIGHNEQAAPVRKPCPGFADKPGLS